jgi:predicted XRE-type DNA-binding protein
MSTRGAKTKKRDDTTVVVGSGNVFADLGLPHPEQRLAKAKLAGEIADIIDGLSLTQAQAGKLLGIDQPKVSMLMRGQLKDFSMERLFQFLNRLGRDIEIGIKRAPRGQAGLRVLAKAS